MLRTLYLDRVFAIAIGAICTVMLIALKCYGAPFDMNIALLAAVSAAYTCVARDRTISPIERIRESAGVIAQIVDAPWIVMGHTHHPTVVELPNGARYVNVGHWGEDDLPEERAEQPSPNMSTYLHLRWDGREYRGELRQWDARAGDRAAVLEEKRRRSTPRQNGPLIAPAQP